MDRGPDELLQAPALLLGLAAIQVEGGVGADPHGAHPPSLKGPGQVLDLALGQAVEVVSPDLQLPEPGRRHRVEQIHQGPAQGVVRRPAVGLQHDRVEEQLHG